jgi:hypothetical protein
LYTDSARRAFDEAAAIFPGAVATAFVATLDGTTRSRPSEHLAIPGPAVHSMAIR